MFSAMCGIVGFKSIKDFKVLRESLLGAASSLTHRGPDDSGLLCDARAGVGLAHRRLSIIDLSSAGRQPMASDNGTVHIVYNGEVFNFREIRETLEGYGHRFTSSTDTEVILKAYLQWGIECLHDFIGMFSFALWDSRQQRLYLVRDRLGIKPLYYYAKNGTLLFASELKGLMAFKSFERAVDPDAVPLFLHYQYIPAPKTVFKDTYKLLPGQYLVCDGRDLRNHTYWGVSKRPESAELENVSEEERLAELDQLLTNAVSVRLISDVPLGALLSGGIDSSLVVALMQKLSNAPVRTFSIGFDEQKYDEAPWAARVAAHLGTDHTEFYVTPGEAMEVIPKLPDIHDEPFADTSAIPTYLVCRLARTQVTAALSGDGGDEQFAGYVRYWSTQTMTNLLQRVPRRLREFSARLSGIIPFSWIERCYLPWYSGLPQRFQVVNIRDKWSKLIPHIGESRISELYRATISFWSREELGRLTGGSVVEGRYEETFNQTEDWPLLARLMLVDLNTYLPDAMLTKVDRASMAVSLEVRVPLLDHRVVEYTSKLPDNLKFRNGTGKYLLKKLLGQYVPARLFERPKMGFTVPLYRWFNNELKDLLLDNLSSERLKREGLFNQALVEKKLKEHLSGQLNHQLCLWPLLMWEMWRERWLNGVQETQI
jgi:asparagine synthase (glutamine-hydrolysing)